MATQLETLEAAIVAFPEEVESNEYDWSLSRALWDVLLSIQSDGKIYTHGATIHDFKRLAVLSDCENVIDWNDAEMVERLILWVREGAFN